jgi:hypothetical protein
MPEHGERVVGLEIDGRPVMYFSAGLFRGQARLPRGARGHTSWRLEIFDPDLAPGLGDIVRIRVNSGAGWEAGIALVADDRIGPASRLLLLDGTGDLVPE